MLNAPYGRRRKEGQKELPGKRVWDQSVWDQVRTLELPNKTEHSFTRSAYKDFVDTGRGMQSGWQEARRMDTELEYTEKHHYNPVNKLSGLYDSLNHSTRDERHWSLTTTSQFFPLLGYLDLKIHRKDLGRGTAKPTSSPTVVFPPSSSFPDPSAFGWISAGLLPSSDPTASPPLPVPFVSAASPGSGHPELRGTWHSE